MQFGEELDSPEETVDEDAARAKRGHVLKELLETERIYVQEICSILKVNKLFKCPFNIIKLYLQSEN